MKVLLSGFQPAPTFVMTMGNETVVPGETVCADSFAAEKATNGVSENVENVFDCYILGNKRSIFC